MPAPTTIVGSTVKVTGFGSTKQASAKLVGLVGRVVSISDAGNAKVEFDDGKSRSIGLADIAAVRVVSGGPSKTAIFEAIRAVRAELRIVESAYQLNEYAAPVDDLAGSVATLAALAAEKFSNPEVEVETSDAE